jgi:DNA repair protein RadC
MKPKASDSKQNQGHRQRLRDKYKELSINGLTDDETLELLLTLGTPRVNCKDTARALLKKFGTLAQVFEADQQQLMTVKGMGEQNSFALIFIHDVARRFLAQRIQGKNYLKSSKDVSEYLNHAMRHLKKEVFMVIYLDSSFAILDTKTIFEGTLAANTIYPREFIKSILDINSAAVIIAHNHPSGSQTPSQADLQLTRNLHHACAMLDIRLLDHLIIGREQRPYSFADHGTMEEIQTEFQNMR